MKKCFALLVILTMVGCSGYHGWTQMKIEGKNLKRGVMGGITGEEVIITIIRETSTANQEMCCDGRSYNRTN